MKIAEGKDVRLGVCDIETLVEMFDVGIYNPDTREWKEFEVSKYRNELYEFVAHYTSRSYDYLVTFNGIGFDQQVLEWVVDNHQKWYDLNGLEIAEKISNFAQELIENTNYGLFAPYKESRFTIPAIDLFRIHHFDNEARRTSLKWCEFMFNMDVEEMPIHHLRRGLTEAEIELVREYRRHDVMATYRLLELTLGEVDLPELADYKGKNAIQNRFYIMEDTGLQCLNWSDVKIGEESNKLRYMKAEGIKDERELFPTKVKHPYGKKFKEFFPKVMEFKTKKLQDFVRQVGNQYVKSEKQEFPITIGDTTFTVAKGGIHSTEKNRKLVLLKGQKRKDADVGGQYPNACDKYEIYPPHLKITILTNLKGSIQRKDKYKQMGKEATDKKEKSRLKGLETGTKLEMNGGYFGKMGQKGSFLEYPEGVLKVTMANQIEILMLIEALNEAGFKVESGNTDGIVTSYPEDKEDEYMRICTEWEEKVGNVKMGKLEYANIVGLWQESVNSYIAKIEDKGEIKIKKKGRFMTEFELNKNKSMRIVPLALEAYFIRGEDPIEFVRNHKNIFDFCIAKKASGNMHYEEQWTDETGIRTKVHKKLVRYFVSTEGTILYKRGWNHEGKSMNNHVNAPTDLGQPLVTYFNRFYKAEDYKVDYNHYILEVLERIDAIEKTRKAKAFVDGLNPGQQLSLF
jgi:hypothetical protein